MGIYRQSNSDQIETDKIGESYLNKAEQTWLAFHWNIVIYKLLQHLGEIQPNN